MPSTATSKQSSTTRGALDRRRTEILEKAIHLFAAHCYDGTDTQLLANELQVGKGTLYRYFEKRRSCSSRPWTTLLTKMRAMIDAAAETVNDPLRKSERACWPTSRFTPSIRITLKC